MTTQNKLDAKTSAEIETGKFSSNYLIYNRKSTDEAENQKSSLNYQRSENTRFANRERLSIAPITLPGLCTNGVVSEKHSGFKEDDTLWITDAGEVRYRIDRPKFQLLVQHLNKEHFKGLICLSWDRISRNRGDDTIVRKLMRKGVDIRFVYANYDDSSAGELHMDIDGMFAQHHSRVTSEKIRLATRSQRAKGKCTYRAPIGYLNLGNVEDKPHDPERAPLIKELFELYATGDWSLSDLARHARKQGLKTVAMRPKRTRSEILADDDADEDKERPKVSRPVGQSLISRVLNNPFYTGKVVGPDGIYVDSTCHEAIIDKGTFELVQSMLGKKNVSVHYTKKLDHPLRGMVRCRLCNRVYSPYLKKGILYFYARCAPGCKNSTKSCNSQFLSDKIYKLLKTLSFSTDELAAIDARISTEIALLEERRSTETARSERSKKRIREDLAYLRTNQLTLLRSGTYEPDTLLDERTRLEHELDQLQNDEQISEAAMRDLMKVVIRVSELLNNTAELYKIADPYDKEQITKAIFSELFLANNTLTYKAQVGLEALFNRKTALGAPREWLSELHGKKKHLLELTEILDLMAK